MQDDSGVTSVGAPARQSAGYARQGSESAHNALRIVSHGGGWQTTALLVLAAQGEIDFPLFLFANVGDDSENPKTLDYLREVAIPYGAAHGVEVAELQRQPTRGAAHTLHEELTRPQGRSIPIPARTADLGAPGNRRCTETYKLAVVAREAKRRGATADNPAIVAIGFSVDEVSRIGRQKAKPWERKVYPLLDLNQRRSDCAGIITRAGLPLPPKSACYFCPMKRPSEWQTMRRVEPELFAKAVEVERAVIARRTLLGKDPMYLTRFGRPLDEAITDGQLALLDDEEEAGCDSGGCFL